jgi:mono/diheme cytochrome c family protein
MRTAVTVAAAARLSLAAGLVLVVVAGATAASRNNASTSPTARDQAALVARGEYLTHSVAMCVECHSPRDQRGNIIRSEEFQGGPNLVSAPYWGPDWASREPAIAGLPGFTDEQVIALLMTGKATDRDPPKKPMPPFRLNREDAEAIVAYLRTK